MDSRAFWVLRHCLYKTFVGQLKGIGYMGPPSFALGLRHLYVGSGFGIFPGWRIEIIDGEVHIGNNVRIGNNLFLNCGSQMMIGDDVTISANVFLGTTEHRATPSVKEHFKQWPTEERPVRIGSGCFIGYGAVLLPGTSLGEGCVIGANAVVRGAYPPGTILSASKAQILRNRAECAA